MEKNLPKVYANPINKPLNNNRDVYYGNSGDTRSVSDINVLGRINEIFASKTHVYKSSVRITTDKDTFDSIIVGKTNDYLLTLSGAKISIPTIKNIEKI